MNPIEKDPSRLYFNFKVHKQKEHDQVPPVRAIISASDSVTEIISSFVEHHIKDKAVHHKSCLRDKSHFLRVIGKKNQGKKLATNVMFVRSDITNTNHKIPQKDSSDCLKDELDKREDKIMP